MHSQRAQAMVEFALISIPLLMLLLGLMDMGMIFERRIALTNAVRDGARWAASHPSAWSNLASAPSNTIQGQVQLTASVSNDDSSLVVIYMQPGPGSPTVCGEYLPSTGYVPQNGISRQSCIVPGDLIEVRAGASYPLVTPLMQALVGTNLTITVQDTMLEEVPDGS